MANWVIPDEGKTYWLDRALLASGFTTEDYTLKGFQNDYTPDDASTASSFTESSYTGYLSVTITHSSFPASTITSHVAYSAAPDASFTCTGGSTQTMYGVYLVGATTGKVLAAVRFDNPRSMSPGATETVTPKFGLKTFA